MHMCHMCEKQPVLCAFYEINTAKKCDLIHSVLLNQVFVSVIIDLLSCKLIGGKQ